MVQQILGNSTKGNVINLTFKISVFFFAKHCVMEWNVAKIYIWAFVNFRICRRLAIFPTVFSFRLTSYSGVKGSHITRAVAGNPRFHLLKTVFCWTVFDTPFQITIMRSYRTAMFVFYASWNLKFPVRQFFLFIYFLKRQPHEHGYFRAIEMTPPYSYTVWPALWKFSSIATVLLSVPFSPVCVFIHL